MEHWEWENFEQKITHKDYQCIEKGEFGDIFNSFKLYRDEKFNLMLEVETTFAYTKWVNPRDSYKNSKVAGEFYSANQIVLKHRFLDDIVFIDGAFPQRCNESFDYTKGVVCRKEIASVYSISYQLKSNLLDCNPKFLIEWIENFDESNWLFPESSKKKTEILTTKEFGSGAPQELKMESRSGVDNYSRDCVHLTIEGLEFYFGKANFDKNRKKAAFILYKHGSPCINVRNKIRDCLSFLVGSPLLYLGFSSYSEEWFVTEFESVTPQTQDGSFLNVSAMPPMLLGVRSKNEIDSAVLENSLKLLCGIYEQYNLRHVFWVYWTAVCTPVYSAAVHFGAIIESLQKSYLEVNAQSFKKNLVSASIFRGLKNSFLKELAELEVEEAEKLILKNKFTNLNQTPSNQLMQRFFEVLGFELNNNEQAAWQQRNNVAHGRSIDGDDAFRLAIRNTKILKVLAHRLILKIAQVDMCLYYDYASLTFPLKSLQVDVDLLEDDKSLTK